MSEIEIKNAVITDTMLGIEDHGILTCFVYLDYGGTSQGFGGYALDGYDEAQRRRVSVSFGGEFIRRTLEAVGVERWEQLKGKNCRAKSGIEKIHAIGHIIKDQWFDPSHLMRK